ncbi:bile acid:sodium symporter family protein [Aestuariicella hydrocarbonica]|uniref:Bile acid:sodium symporter family protein n=1 Tax=Pseudomaricurvus hydrocarbonicus TaxID=1470433 RepID=A0A9E5MLJ9_9GAMM|nr:bile acid:sodium symporter [Aestuariicella hydrocarbonica]NHO64025.1 bile acid:sodium symporter family protein [Aestuariicella hydrocarbonica]
MFEWYVENEYWFAAVQLFLAMLGMGATLRLQDFTTVLKTPKAVTLGCLTQLVAVPLVTFGLIVSLGLTGGVLVGIALIAAIPGGSVSNIFTYLAKGSVPLSISVTAFTTVACLITTPLILGFLISAYMPPDFTMPARQIATEITLCLLIPLILGMLILQFLPGLSAWVSRWGIRGSLFAIMCIVVGSAGAGRLNVGAFGWSNVALIGLFFLLLAAIGALLPRLFRLVREDSTAIEMEVVVRNINLGLLIKVSLFPAVHGVDDPLGNFVLFSLLLYGALQTFLGLALVVWRRKGALQLQPE